MIQQNIDALLHPGHHLVNIHPFIIKIINQNHNLDISKRRGTTSNKDSISSPMAFSARTICTLWGRNISVQLLAQTLISPFGQLQHIN
jgi:hypothetical protein